MHEAPTNRRSHVSATGVTARNPARMYRTPESTGSPQCRLCPWKPIAAPAPAPEEQPAPLSHSVDDGQGLAEWAGAGISHPAGWLYTAVLVYAPAYY